MTSANTTDKPFVIDKRRVYEAYKAVKSNKGAGRVDGQTIEQFELDLKGHLYKVWNCTAPGKLLPTAGTGCRHSKEVWRWRKDSRSARRERSDRPDGGKAAD